ncbi:hypothetical protein [Phaeobacter piscinae]|uniref:hypothetical protein n=1 Tax=Phaeobacter piscinae TaxID=1580596 RepID=UPI000598B7B1|nr:hypothetical protein [Phaeobacter piscinae]KII14531.1 hypothetical protein OO25_13430 [Phaeobacter sp. S60]
MADIAASFKSKLISSVQGSANIAQPPAGIAAPAFTGAHYLVHWCRTKFILTSNYFYIINYLDIKI